LAIDEGVMPATRPEAISNRVRLSNEERAAPRRLVAEDCAVDAFLSAVVDELSPDEQRITALGPQNQLRSGSDEQAALASISVATGRVVPLIQLEAVKIAVPGHPPQRPFLHRPGHGLALSSRHAAAAARGTWPLPRQRNRSTRWAIPSTTRPTAGSAVHQSARSRAASSSCA